MGATFSKPRESTSVDVESSAGANSSHSLAVFSPFNIFSYTGVTSSTYLHAALYSFWRWGSGIQYHSKVQAIKSAPEQQQRGENKDYVSIDLSSSVLDASTSTWFSPPESSSLDTSNVSYSSGATIVELDGDVEHEQLTIVSEIDVGGNKYSEFGSVSESYPDYLSEGSIQQQAQETKYVDAQEHPTDLQSVDLESSNSSIELQRDLAMITSMSAESVDDLKHSYVAKEAIAELDTFYAAKSGNDTSFVGNEKTSQPPSTSSSRRTSTDLVEYNPCVTAEDFVKVPKYDFLCANDNLLDGFYSGFDATNDSMYVGKPLMDLLLPENIAKSRLSKTSGESVLQKRSLSPGAGEVVKTVAEDAQPVEAVAGKKNLILNRIFVWKLDKETTDEDMTSCFKKFGKIQEIQIIYGRNNRQRRYGFVTFEEIEDCKKLLEKKDELELVCRDQKIFFSEAFFQPKREEKVVCNVCKKNNVKKIKPNKKPSFYDRPKPTHRYPLRRPLPPSLDYNGFQRYPYYPNTYRHAPRRSIW